MKLPLPGLSRRPLLALLLGLAFVLLLWLTALEARRRGALYWHDVTLDHSYDFAQARPFTLAVGPTELVVPEPARAAHTLVLELEVDTGLAGRWFEPWLAITSPDGSQQLQYFERGARGRRYVLLPEDDGHEGELRLSLRGGHLNWATGDARLHAFFEQVIPPGPVLVIAPHPDDAEIAAFDLYASSDSWIVTITSGNGADRRMDELLTDPTTGSRLKGQLRAWDSVAIPQWAGVPAARAVNFGYFTLSLADMYASPDMTIEDDLLENADISIFRRSAHSELLDRPGAESSWASLVADLMQAVDRIDPATIVAPHPALDGAMDHKLSTIALLEALDGLPTAERHLLLYTNHHATSEYYPFGPASALASPPPWTEEAMWMRQIYSNPVDATQQLRKLYALEAQHDLRPAPTWVDARPLRHLAGRISSGVRDLLRDPTGSYSYMRRGARPNELFFVYEQVDVPKIRAMVETTLTDLRDGSAVAPQRGY